MQPLALLMRAKPAHSALTERTQLTRSACNVRTQRMHRTVPVQLSLSLSPSLSLGVRRALGRHHQACRREARADGPSELTARAEVPQLT